MDTKIKRAFDHFVRMGWSLEQAAGIVANLVAESSLNPAAVGDGGLAYGIAQWHPDRQRFFSAIIGRDIRGSTFEDQLAFVHAELVNTEKPAGDALRACTTAAAAGATVSRLYERPADRDGEAARRAGAAESILAEMTRQNGPGAAIPAPDGPTPQPEPKPAPAPDPGPQRTPEGNPMPVALILGLAQSIFSMFAPLAQQKIAKELERHTDEGTATTISQGVIDKIVALTNPANPTEAIQAAKTDSSVAIQAVARAQQDAAIIAKAQDYTMEALDKMAPMLDRMAERDKETWQADIASADAAGMRGRQDPWDIAKFVVIGVGALVFLIDAALVAMMIIQTVRTADGEISSTLVAFAGPLLMASIMWFGTIVAYRFGEKRSSSANEASNAIIAQYARRS